MLGNEGMMYKSDVGKKFINLIPVQFLTVNDKFWFVVPENKEKISQALPHKDKEVH